MQSTLGSAIVVIDLQMSETGSLESVLSYTTATPTYGRFSSKGSTVKQTCDPDISFCLLQYVDAKRSQDEGQRSDDNNYIQLT